MGLAKTLYEGGTPPAEASPESFCVRSTSFLLPAGADWVEGAKARVVVKPGGHLTLA
jgi:hypothetical protein